MKASEKPRKLANEKAQTTFQGAACGQACGEVARRSGLLMARGRLLCFSGSFRFVAPAPWGRRTRTCRAFSDASSGEFWTVCSRDSRTSAASVRFVGAVLELTIRLALGGCA